MKEADRRVGKDGDTSVNKSLHGKTGTQAKFSTKQLYDLLQDGLMTGAWIALDTRTVDISTVKADKTLASQTPSASELINSKDGTSGEIDKVDLWLTLVVIETNGSANGLNCTLATDNQLQIAIAGGGAVDLPAGMHGALSGQFADNDLYCNPMGATTLLLKADISNLGATALKANILQAIVLSLKDGLAYADNLRVTVGGYIHVVYNGKAKIL